MSGEYFTQGVGGGAGNGGHDSEATDCSDYRNALDQAAQNTATNAQCGYARQKGADHAAATLCVELDLVVIGERGDHLKLSRRHSGEINEWNRNQASGHRPHYMATDDIEARLRCFRRL